MSVLVTGGAGYIGSHVVCALVDAGEQPVIADDLSTGVLENVPAGVPFHKMAAGARDGIEEILRRHDAREVVHLAGSISVPESVADPVRYYENNLVTSLRLIETCALAGVRRFIFSSTAAVYGAPEHAQVHETDRREPASPYGRTKLGVEWMLEDIAGVSSIDYAVLRYFNVAGADPKGRVGPPNPGGQGLFQSVARAIVAGQPVVIYGDDFDTRDGTGVRDYIHVSDLADVHLAALRNLRSGCGSATLNCGYGRGTSVREVIAAFETVLGHKVPVRVEARRPGDLGSVIADGGALGAKFGWRPRYDDITLMAKTTLEWESRRGVHPKSASAIRKRSARATA